MKIKTPSNVKVGERWLTVVLMCVGKLALWIGACLHKNSQTALKQATTHTSQAFAGKHLPSLAGYAGKNKPKIVGEFL